MAIEETEPYVDLFIFSRRVSSAASDFIKADQGLLEGKEPPRPYVRFTQRVFGPHELFTAMVLDSEEQAADALIQMRTLAAPDVDAAISTESYTCIQNGTLRVKRSNCPRAALTIATLTTAANPSSVLDRMDHLAGYRGSCLLSTGYQILLELGANDSTTLSGRLSGARSSLADVVVRWSTPDQLTGTGATDDCAQ
jgi:hypothetical protein